MALYPNNIYTTDSVAGSTIRVGHATLHDNEQNEVVAIETYAGVENSTVNNTLDYMVRHGWINDPNAPTYGSSTEFSVTGDRTNLYTTGRKVRFNDTIYASVVSSAYVSGSSLTNVIVDSSVVPSTITSLDYGSSPDGATIITETNIAIVSPSDTQLSGIKSANIDATAGILPAQVPSILSGYILDGNAATYVSATSFTLPYNATSIYTAGRLVQFDNAGTLTTGVVISSSYASPTTTVVTDGGVPSTITSLSYGIAPLGDTQLKLNQLLPTAFGDQVQTLTNSGTAGGTMSYINLGGIKLLWTKTPALSFPGGSSSSYTITFPSGFFTTISSDFLTPENNTGSGATILYWSSLVTPTSGTFQIQNQGSAAGTAQIDIFVIGT